MQGSFTKGLIVGSVIGAAVSMVMDPDMMSRRNRKKIMRTGRNFIKRSGDIIGDVVHMFR